MASALLASRKVTYSAGLELTQLQADAAKIQSILRGAFEGLKIDGSKIFDTQSLEQASKQAQSVLLQQAQQQKAVAQTALQAERTQTQEARAQAQERISIAKAEEQERIQAAKAAATQIIEQEKRATEAQRQQRPTQQGSTLTGIGGAIGGAVAGFLTVQGARQALAYTQQIAELRKEVLLASSSFNVLSGGAAQATARLNAIKQASGGTVTTLDALKVGNQLTALGLASTATEFGKLTRAAREVTFVSPVIHDIGSAISELSLASANLSFRRLDQLGLTTTEVKQRMAELQSANSNLSDSQAFLQAAVDALDSKFGKLTDSSAAQAQGIDKLKVAWAEFQNQIATGGVGDAADQALGTFGDVVNAITVKIGSRSAPAIAQTLQANLRTALEQADSFSDPFSKLVGTDERYRQLAANLQRVIDVQKAVNDAVTAGVPGAASLASGVNELAAKIANLGTVSDADLKALINYEARLNSGSVAMEGYAEAVKSAEEASRKLNEAQSAAQAEAIAGAQKQITDAIGKKATDAAPVLGSGQTIEILRQQLEKAKALIADFEKQGLQGKELEIAVSVALPNLTDVFDQVAQQTQDAIGKNTAIELGDSAAKGIEALNTSFVDLSPALSSARTELIGLANDIALSGTATQEQANRQAELLAITDALSGTTGAYAALQDAQGQALLSSNQYANDLVTQMILLDAAQASGKISTEQHAGAMSVLIGRLIDTAEKAGLATDAVLALKNVQAGLPTSGGLGFTSGQRFGRNQDEILKANEAARQREESRRAAERAAREQESAAKKAAREFEQGIKKAGQAFASELQNVPGLFGSSKVTENQLALAKGGIPQNFADDYLRRLKDVAENNKKRSDVNIDDARTALRNIGVDPAGDIKLLAKQLEDAWNDSSLFSNKDNIALLINQDAVKANLALQEKMKQGRQNIQEFFGVVIDDATGEILGVAKDKTDTEKLNQAVKDGKKKLVEDLTGTVKDAVDGATGGAAVATGGGVGTGTISGATFAPGAISFDGVAIPPLPISAVTFPPDVLKNIFTGVEIPAVKVTTVTIDAGAGQAVVSGLADQLAQKVPDFLSQGGTIASVLKKGIADAKLEGIADSFIGAIDTQFSAQSEKLSALGVTAIGNVANGAVTAVLPDMGASFLAAMATQFGAKVPDFIFNGGVVASATESGFTARFNTAATETGMADALRIAFGTQVQATRDKFSAQGDNLAGIIDSAFIGHWSGANAEGGKADTSLSDAFLTKLQSQFGSGDSLTAYETIGSNVGAILGGGFSGYDFSTVAASAIAGIQSGFRTEENLTAIYNSGGALANTLHDGFIATVNQATWIADVKDAIVAEVLSDLAAGAEKKK